MICHGNSDEHCCWVNGVRCVNLLEGQEVADEVARLVVLYDFKGPLKTAAQKIGDGINFACGVALKVLAETYDATNDLPDRATFEAAWTAHADYQSVADAWEANGKPRGWCATYGPSENQCCFAEDQATNDARAIDVPVVVKNLRSALNGAS